MVREVPLFHYSKSRGQIDSKRTRAKTEQAATSMKTHPIERHFDLDQ